MIVLKSVALSLTIHLHKNSRYSTVMGFDRCIPKFPGNPFRRELYGRGTSVAKAHRYIDER